MDPADLVIRCRDSPQSELLAAQKVVAAGAGGAIYATELFTHERGEATAFVPCGDAVRATGRVSSLVVPEV